MQIVLYTEGGEVRVESHKILPLVSSDVDVLVVHGDEGSHEEASERKRQLLAEIARKLSRDPC